MAVSFHRGQQLGPCDLNVFLESTAGYPTNAAEIHYALYDFTTGQEVLLGPPRRDPANPAVGSYYASIIVPLDANIGSYRVRWTFRERIGSPVHQVVQEFDIIDKATLDTALYSCCEEDMIRRLRILLRDNCVGGEETVELDVDGERMVVRMDDLWEAFETQCGKIRSAFNAGRLRVWSVSPHGSLQWKRVLGVQRAAVGPESIWQVETESGPTVLTGGHRVYTSPTTKVEAEKLSVGCKVLGVLRGTVGQSPVIGCRRIDNRQYMYDLTAEDWCNFALYRSGTIISNSPDRNYHFRPPAHETTVGQFNQVFGYIWEDSELQEFVQRSVDRIAASPPRTPFGSCDQLVQCYPEWKTLLLNGAMMDALFALMVNWISDEFDYNIGGVGLTIEKSSKYESAYNAMKDSFESQLERAKQTVKTVKGLQQPRFGVGIRSAFGPYAGRGQLTPRKYVGF